MVFPKMIVVLLIVSAIASLLGFFRFVWFMSVGYGLAVAAIGTVLLVTYWSEVSFFSNMLPLLLIVYGLRLSGYLLYRELKNKNYQESLKKAVKETTGEKKIPVFVSFFVWIYVSVEYVLQTAPIAYRFVNGDNSPIWAVIGCLIMLSGFLLEAVSDKQKSAAKKKNPHRFVNSGLFSIVRCPNYLGEIIFWFGVFVSGFGAVKTAGQWIVCIIGLILIVYVMLSGAKRLENRQSKNYGDDPEYQEYYRKTPAIFPGIPLYSLKDIKWIV